MSEISLRAIVLRRTDSGESDRRLTLLTFELGKIDATAKGARKGASRLASVSEPLAVATFQIAAGKRTKFITQAQPTLAYRKLRTEFDRLTLALALAELYSAVAPWEQPVPELFELLEQSLHAIEKHESALVAFIWAECRLLAEAGYWPSFSECVVDGTSIQVSEPWVSPRAGGFLSETAANSFTDRFRVRAEVLYGLTKIVELEEPPKNLRFSAETALCLRPFWSHFAECPLPANDYALQFCLEGKP